MSTMNVTSIVNPYRQYSLSSANPSQSNLQSLSSALQSGNLTAAQNAFASFEQSFSSSNSQQAPSSQSSQSNPVTNDIQTLSSALNSGNLTSAQQAFAQLQKDMQAQQGSGHHHHHGGGGGQGQAIQSLISSLSSNGTT
jgi:hypothetical protein